MLREVEVCAKGGGSVCAKGNELKFESCDKKCFSSRKVAFRKQILQCLVDGHLQRVCDVPPVVRTLPLQV